MPLGIEVDLDPSDFVLDGDPAPVRKKAQLSPNFRHSGGRDVRSSGLHVIPDNKCTEWVGSDVTRFQKADRTKRTRHRTRTSTRRHFAFGAMLSQQRNPCTDCKSAQ